MVEYKCDKCQKYFNKKSNFISHINRKNPCSLSPQSLQSPPNSPPEIELISEKVFSCQYCDKIFTRKDHLTRHLNGRCKSKSDTPKQKEEIFQKLMREVEELKLKNREIDQIKKENMKMRHQNDKLLRQVNELKIGGNININKGKITNNNIGQINNNNNNNINIKLVAFKKEDISFITDDVYKKILNKGFKSVPSLVEYIHFNKKQPQNRNIYISNMRDKYALVYDGKDWQLREREMILKELIDDKTDILSCKFDEMIEKLDEFTIRKFRRFLDESDDNEVVSQIKDDLRLTLYNNRKMIDCNRNLVECSNDDDID